MKATLVIMAAGLGSRYGGNKQVDGIGPNGEILMEYSIFDALRAGFTKVVFIIKPDMRDLMENMVGHHLAARKTADGDNVEVCYAYQDFSSVPDFYTVPSDRVKPFGTVHALLCAREFVHEPFVVINADDYYGPQGFKLVYDYLSSHADGDRYAWSMVGFLLGNTVSANGSVSRGVCVTDAQHNLVSVTERTCIEPYDGGIHYSEDGGKSWTHLPGDTIVSMNLWGLPREFMDEAWNRFPAFLEGAKGNEKAEYFLPSVISSLIEKGKATVKVLRSTDKWYGVTYHADKAAVTAAIARMTASGLYPDNLWK